MFHQVPQEHDVEIVLQLAVFLAEDGHEGRLRHPAETVVFVEGNLNAGLVLIEMRVGVNALEPQILPKAQRPDLNLVRPSPKCALHFHGQRTRIASANENMLAGTLEESEHEIFPVFDKRQFVKEHPDVLQFRRRIHLTVGLKDQIQLLRRHVLDSLVIKTNPKDIFLLDAVRKKPVDRNLHQGGLATTTHTRNSDDLIPVNRQRHISVNHGKWHFRLLLCNQGLEDVLFAHGTFPFLTDRPRLIFPFLKEVYHVSGFIVKRESFNFDCFRYWEIRRLGVSNHGAVALPKRRQDGGVPSQRPAQSGAFPISI